MQGWRRGMEDTHITIPNLADDVAFFGVFDGHGGILASLIPLGQQVAVYAKKYLPDMIKFCAAFKAKNYKQALIDTFLAFDKRLESDEGRKEFVAANKAEKGKSPVKHERSDSCLESANFVGCTACVALITKTEIIVANSGDSRCVLAKNGIAINMSVDHKPDMEKEKRRIEKANGFVEENRVNGALNLSRSLGDLDFKKNKKLKQEEQMITALPDVLIEKISNDTDFLILACDGIWDCMSSQNAVDYMQEQVVKAKHTKDGRFKISKVIESMLDKILAKGVESSGIVAFIIFVAGLGCDNMTCMVIELIKHK